MFRFRSTSRVIVEQVLNGSSSSTALEIAAGVGRSPRVAPYVRGGKSEEAARVRRFEPRDLAQVTDLFIETFRPDARGKHAAAARSIGETYLARPTFLDQAHSLVHVEESGEVTGFVGLLPATMRMNGRLLSVGILGAFMVARPERHPTVAMRLGHAVRALPLDLVMSDTANPRSLSFGRPLRFDLLPTHGLEWFKALRPAETFARLFTRRIPRMTPVAAGLARLVEPLARRVYDPSLNAQAPLSTTTRPIDAEAFVERAETLTRDWSLKPEWRSEAVRWLIGQAARKVRNGPMRLYEVVERNDRLAGAYILYAAPGKVAHAVQILARPNREREVVASLLRHADDEGASAVRGVVDSSILTGLAGVPRVFYHQAAAAVAFSHDPEIRVALREGRAMIGGLVGERWNRLVADPFD